MDDGEADLWDVPEDIEDSGSDAIIEEAFSHLGRADTDDFSREIDQD